MSMMYIVEHWLGSEEERRGEQEDREPAEEEDLQTAGPVQQSAISTQDAGREVLLGAETPGGGVPEGSRPAERPTAQAQSLPGYNIAALICHEHSNAV